jgi:hypothetical protein
LPDREPAGGEGVVPLLNIAITDPGGSPVPTPVQSGQFLRCVAQSASNLLVALHTNKRIERLLAYLIVMTLAINQTPTLQPVEPAYDGGAGYPHKGGNLGHRERLAFNIAKRHA